MEAAAVSAEIERLATEYAAELYEGRRPALRIPKRSSGNVEEHAVSFVRRMGPAVVESRLTKQSLRKHAAMWAILDHVHTMAAYKDETCMTQRDLYYSIKEHFGSQRHANSLIQDVCCILQSPRSHLGIVASPRGFVHGPIAFRCQNVTLSAASAPLSISHQLTQPCTRTSTTATRILLVEKESVFQRLVHADVAHVHNCIVITGQGYPSIATRCLLQRIVNTHNLPVYGLVDLNPHGAAILLTFVIGSQTGGIESDMHCTPVTWMGLHPRQVEQLPIDRHKYTPMTRQDMVLLHSLQGTAFVQHHKEWHDSLAAMEALGLKLDLEAVDQTRPHYLANILVPRLLYETTWTLRH